MKFKIHRGAQEIGGSCVEIWTDSTRVVIDFGMPLVNPDRSRFDSNAIQDKSKDELLSNGILPNIPGLYEKSDQTALLLSHAHQDHYGLMRYLHRDCKVYLGRATLKLIELTNVFTYQDWTISNACHFESGGSFTFGDIEVTPYLMDHSATDSYAFMIRAGNKTLFYSGDFRLHGRKPGYFEFLRKTASRKVDYLLLEGTTIGRQEQHMLTETEIEEALIDTFRKSRGISLIYTSGQNIDRLVSIYKACRRSGKIMTIDFYIANVLKELSKHSAVPHPSPKFPGIRVFYPINLAKMIMMKGKKELLYRFRHYKITRDEINAESGKIVMLVRPSMSDFYKRLDNLGGGYFIYSMWTGYRDDRNTSEFINYFIDKGMTDTVIHTSGHADREGLGKLVDVLQPKYIVPIHTFEPRQYERIFSEANVLRLADGEICDASGGVSA